MTKVSKNSTKPSGNDSMTKIGRHEPTVFYVFYFTYLNILIFSLIGFAFGAFLGHYSFAPFGVIGIQLIYMVPGYYAARKDLIGHRTIFLFTQAGLFVADIIWMAMAFIMGKGLLGGIFMGCVIVQLSFTFIVYAKPYDLMSKKFQKLWNLFASTEKKPENQTVAKPVVSSNKSTIANWTDKIEFNDSVKVADFFSKTTSGGDSVETIVPVNDLISKHNNMRQKTPNK